MAQDFGGKLREQVKDESDVGRNSLLLSAFLRLLKWIASLLKEVPSDLKEVFSGTWEVSIDLEGGPQTVWRL